MRVRSAGQCAEPTRNALASRRHLFSARSRPRAGRAARAREWAARSRAQHKAGTGSGELAGRSVGLLRSTRSKGCARSESNVSSVSSVRVVRTRPKQSASESRQSRSMLSRLEASERAKEQRSKWRANPANPANSASGAMRRQPNRMRQVASPNSSERPTRAQLTTSKMTTTSRTSRTNRTSQRTQTSQTASNSNTVSAVLVLVAIQVLSPQDGSQFCWGSQVLPASQTPSAKLASNPLSPQSSPIMSQSANSPGEFEARLCTLLVSLVSLATLATLATLAACDAPKLHSPLDIWPQVGASRAVVRVRPRVAMTTQPAPLRSTRGNSRRSPLELGLAFGLRTAAAGCFGLGEPAEWAEHANRRYALRIGRLTSSKVSAARSIVSPSKAPQPS